MKNFIYLLTVLVALASFTACSAPEPYTGEPIAPAAVSDTQVWPVGTFFDSAPHIAATVKSVTVNEAQTTYSIKITDISYDDFVKWAQAMKESGVSPVGSGEYGLSDGPIDGMASFNGECKQYTVISTWTDKASAQRVSDCDLSLSFIKKK